MPIFFLILLIFSTSCKQNSSESELHITNGVLDDNEYPAVVQIHTEADGSCTGTFIRGNVLLTAAHCVIEGQIEGQPVVIESLTSKPKSTDIFIHKRFETDERVDAALVFFSEQLSLSPRELEFTKPKVGEKVTFVGYGKNAYFEDGTSTGSGEKRVGRNNIVAFVENFFRIIGTPHAQPSPEGPTGENSSLGMGDSGGPAFNDQGKIIGISAQGGRIEGRQYGHFTVMSVIKDFVEEALKLEEQQSKHTSLTGKLLQK